jgi:peptidoglycan/xylan/chitin deacetylase (PgdA/CDA1 family)
MHAQGIGGAVPILMYHSISEQATPAYEPFTVSPDMFAEHIAYLRQHDYTVMTMTQLAQARYLDEGSLPERPVVLTFDDGLADFYHSAFPVLKRYNISATLYIVTAYVNGTSQWLRSKGEEMRPMLSWEQIREISAQGIECGGHSHTHRQLDILSSASARDEIVRNKEELEQHLQHEISAFSYPYGYYTSAIQRMVRDAGYTSACTVQYEVSAPSDNPFAMTRLNIDRSIDTNALEALLHKPLPSSPKPRLKRALAYGWRVKRSLASVIDDYRDRHNRRVYPRQLELTPHSGEAHPGSKGSISR